MPEPVDELRELLREHPLQPNHVSNEQRVRFFMASEEEKFWQRVAFLAHSALRRLEFGDPLPLGCDPDGTGHCHCSD